MSYRTYSVIGDSEEKIYDHVETHGEYLCDVCGKILEPLTPQLHITVSGTQFESAREGQKIPQFRLDLHPDCILLSGRCILGSLPSMQATQLMKTWDSVMDTFRMPADPRFQVEAAKFIAALAGRIMQLQGLDRK